MSVVPVLLPRGLRTDSRPAGAPNVGRPQTWPQGPRSRQAARMGSRIRARPPPPSRSSPKDLPMPSTSITAPRTRWISASGTPRPRVVHLRRGAADGSRPAHQPCGDLPDRCRRRTTASTAIPASRNRRKAVMCPKAVSTTTPNRTAASGPRLGTRRGLRSSGWTRSLRLRFCISTNTYSRWLLFIDRWTGLSPRQPEGLRARPGRPDRMDSRPGGRTAPGTAAVRPGRPEQAGMLARYRPGQRVRSEAPARSAADGRSVMGPMASLAHTGSWGSSPRATPSRGEHRPVVSRGARAGAPRYCLQGEGGERACSNPPDDIAAGYVEDL